MTTDKGASFSEGREYRYALWRVWDKSKPLVAFIGLNPSTANETEPDNTIKKVTKVAANNGYGGFFMLNLFTIVSSDPSILLTHPNPVNEADATLLSYSKEVKDVVFCWGAFKHAKKRAEVVKKMFPDALCFKHTKAGDPWHPLYCKDDTKLITYRR